MVHSQAVWRLGMGFSALMPEGPCGGFRRRGYGGLRGGYSAGFLLDGIRRHDGGAKEGLRRGVLWSVIRPSQSRLRASWATWSTAVGHVSYEGGDAVSEGCFAGVVHVPFGVAGEENLGAAGERRGSRGGWRS